MKTLIPIFLLLVPFVSHAQNNEHLKNNIDSTVQSIDLGKGSKVVRFQITALKKVFHLISYEYQTWGNQVTKIQRQFSHKEDSITQIFYLRNGQLIYALEEIVSHFGNDSMSWSGKFYFAKGKLIDHRTFGHGKSETDNWDPEADIKTALFESRRDIARYHNQHSSLLNL